MKRKRKRNKSLDYASRLDAGFNLMNESEDGPGEYSREEVDHGRGMKGWEDRRLYHEYWDAVPDKYQESVEW
jgi:hypothetical protein